MRNIGFEDAPDYIALRTLLAEMFNEKGYQNDFKYDWVAEITQEPKKNRYHSQAQARNKTGGYNKANFKEKNEIKEQDENYFEDEENEKAAQYKKK